jgi:hypothetical protein
MNFLTRSALGALGALALLTSCAHRAELKADASRPTPATAAPPQAQNAPAANINAHYIVKKGDCLWTIAAKPAVLGDAFDWPLLYKQNRDEIQDPDLIQPHQDLSYKRHYHKNELAQALEQARAQPPYKAPIKVSEDEKY